MAASRKNIPVKPARGVNVMRQIFEAIPTTEEDPTEARDPQIAGQRRKTSFLDLPREVRDMVYDYYWQTKPALNVSSTPFGRFSLQLRYEGYYKMNVGYFGYGSIERLDGRMPWWLLCNKQVLYEALEQFVYKAEWFWDGHMLGERKQYRQSPLLDLSKISRMALHVDSFGSYENPPRPMDRTSADKNLKMLATAIARDQSTSGRIQHLRISGYSRVEYTQESEIFDQAASIISKVMEYFKAFDVAQLELEVFNKSPDRRRTLYEIKYLGSEMDITVKESELRR
ncbi:hypothetical protein N0V83_001635 [Neocucurbitaria cava]|uniref:Uncharacterized protein n=1 Tax=Neocucurbitaria cava TaxID=798079 RepID=A0A9W8YFZ4_9PLEO|nr:hypothetical protein N0V83_001635 [Neocucurbitaria cava]